MNNTQKMAEAPRPLRDSLAYSRALRRAAFSALGFRTVAEAVRQSPRIAIPELEHGCGSWVITNKATGEAVCELYTRAVVEAINQETHTIETAMAYLARRNREARKL